MVKQIGTIESHSVTETISIDTDIYGLVNKEVIRVGKNKTRVNFCTFNTSISKWRT